MRPSRAAAAAVAAASLLAACGGGSKPAPADDLAPLPEASALRGPAVFPQAGTPQAPMASPFPGLANLWTVRRDLTLSDWNLSIDEAGALALGTPSRLPTSGDFDFLLTDAPLDRTLATDPANGQAFADLTWSTPLRTGLGGAVVVTDGTQGLPALNGATVALLGTQVQAAGGAVSGTRLSQAVDLTGVAAGAVLVVGWKEDVFVDAGPLAGSPAGAFRAVLKDAGGAVVATLEDLGFPGGRGERSFPLAAGLPRARLTLEFELSAAATSWATLDDVTFTVDGAEKLTNAGFSDAATPLAGWTAAAPDAPGRLTGAPRAAGGLTVTRSLYLPADGGWARLTDLFENPGATPVTTQAVYLFNLGALGDGVVTGVPGTGGRAWSAWDVSGKVGDVAVVHGTAAAWFRSTTAPGASDGGEFAFSVEPLTVPAGGARAVVHFVVLGTAVTGAGGNHPIPTTRPAGVDATAKAILDGWTGSATYRAYLSAKERAAIVNLP